jgi:hypothetical protein
LLSARCPQVFPGWHDFDIGIPPAACAGDSLGEVGDRGKRDIIFCWTVARCNGRYDLIDKSVKTNQHAFSTGKLKRFGVSGISGVSHKIRKGSCSFVDCRILLF